MNNINIIGGDNFSGRSAYLRNFISETSLHKGQSIGELPYNYLTGIAPTVADELQIHRNSKNIFINRLIEELLKQIKFKQHSYKNPFTLSGGEQAMLAIVTHLLLKPQNFAVDTTLEQLSKEWVLKVLDIFNQLIDTNIIIADNRCANYGLIPTKILYKSNNTFKLNHESFDIESISGECIQLNNIEFAYKYTENILSGLNWKLEPGTIYHLSGLNGAGKTTLAKILTGVLKPQKGYIFVNGQKFDSYHFPGKSCGYSFQNPDEQLFSRTVINELDGKKHPDRARILSSTFGIESVLDKHPHELPFVLRKRLSLAATLSMNRSWYIFDEPTLGQDDKTVNHLANIFIKLVQKGRGIIIISHFSDFLLQCNAKKVNLENGKIT